LTESIRHFQHIKNIEKEKLDFRITETKAKFRLRIQQLREEFQEKKKETERIAATSIKVSRRHCQIRISTELERLLEHIDPPEDTTDGVTKPLPRETSFQRKSESVEVNDIGFGFGDFQTSNSSSKNSQEMLRTPKKHAFPQTTDPVTPSNPLYHYKEKGASQSPISPRVLSFKSLRISDLHSPVKDSHFSAVKDNDLKIGEFRAKMKEKVRKVQQRAVSRARAALQEKSRSVNDTPTRTQKTATDRKKRESRNAKSMGQVREWRDTFVTSLFDKTESEGDSPHGEEKPSNVKSPITTKTIPETLRERAAAAAALRQRWRYSPSARLMGRRRCPKSDQRKRETGRKGYHYHSSSAGLPEIARVQQNNGIARDRTLQDSQNGMEDLRTDSRETRPSSAFSGENEMGDRPQVLTSSSTSIGSASGSHIEDVVSSTNVSEDFRRRLLQVQGGPL